jgi:phosphate transport system substrate-binding protein
VEKEHSSRGDYTSSEDDNVVVQGIAGDKNALGFFGYAYYAENKDKLKVVPIDDGKADNGQGPIAPSPETVSKGTYQPLSRPIFIYVSKKSLERPVVSEYVKFMNENAADLVAEVGYIALPERAYTLAQQRADQRITGSMLGGKGSQVGVSVEELLAKEPAPTAAAGEVPRTNDSPDDAAPAAAGH